MKHKSGLEPSLLKKTHLTGQITVNNCQLLDHGSTLGDRAFPAAAARAWNSLPTHVRNAPTLVAFRQELKTVLFRECFPVD